MLENPASAIKELIENSVDAGAREIRIEIEGGGLQKLLVEDDGCGMDQEDALLCLKRHATSKLRALSDLEQLKTMGFRGEALATLAAVSKLTLRTAQNGIGTEVVSEGNALLHNGLCARNRGTTVLAQSLFFNTPARLKFQKSATASGSAVLKVVQTAALAHPEIRFVLVSNGKQTFEAKKDGWKARIEEVLGAFAHTVERRGKHVALYGLLERPEDAGLTRSGQTLFVNRRPIFSPLIAKAVKEGFGTRLEERRFPAFVLFLELPSDAVDVNVHPQKREVRFQEESALFGFVKSAVNDAFQSHELSHSPTLPWEFTPPPLEMPSFIAHDAPWEQAPLPVLLPQGRAVALLGEFLLVDDGSWTLIDVRGAASCIAWEMLERPKVEMQPLLVSFEWSLGSGDEPDALCERLRNVHLEARVIGKRTVAIDALPSGIELSDLPTLLQELARERNIAAAITRSIRASRRPLSFELASAVWRRLCECKNKTYDPLGKKIAVPITSADLQELFR